MVDARRVILVRVARFAGLLSAGLVVAIFIFIARAELAHDERRCPFHFVGEKTAPGGVRVSEEARRCLSSAEEHRWIADENGRKREIGRRRLRPDAFIKPEYRWSVSRDEKGRLLLFVQNHGTRARRFGGDEVAKVPNRR